CRSRRREERAPTAPWKTTEQFSTSFHRHPPLRLEGDISTELRTGTFLSSLDRCQLEILTIYKDAASIVACGRSVSRAKNVEWGHHRDYRGSRRRVSGGCRHAAGRAGARRLPGTTDRRRKTGSQRDLAGAERGQ